VLLKITNYCSMGCSHCVEDSTVAGSHMTWETFLRALDFTRRIERSAYEAGCPRKLLLSGGECTEHPEIVRFAEEVVRQGFELVLITNGLWLRDPELRQALLRSEWKTLFVQVTNDARFYPKKPELVDDPRVVYVESLTHLIPLGRAARKKNIERHGVPMKHAPTSFNMRSATRSLGSFEKAVALLRMRAATGSSWGNCTPSISDDGSVMAGETRLCFRVGTVDSTNEELTKAVIEMRCNACGLVDNLTQEQKRAIGEATLYLGTE